MAYAKCFIKCDNSLSVVMGEETVVSEVGWRNVLDVNLYTTRHTLAWRSQELEEEIER